MSEPTFRATLEVTGIDGSLLVQRLSGHEGLSELYQLEIDVSTEDAELDLDAAIGRPARLTLQQGEAVRHLHGLLVSFEHGESGEVLTGYRAVLAPSAWMLDQGVDSRILGDLDVRGILTVVLERMGGEPRRIALSRDYVEREVCVQYRESDWAFASRLMEDEGIFYAFEHDETAVTLVIADTRTNHGTMSPEALPFIPASGTMVATEAVQAFTFTRRLRPGKVTARDVSFDNPNLVEEASATRDRDDLERYEPGTRRAEDRLDALHVLRAAGRGVSSSVRLAPGFHFSLTGHPRSSFNARYLVTRVEHHFGPDERGVPRYAASFECIPAESTFRPDRRTPRPRIPGPQGATVVGPEGLELHADEAGRVQVRLHWDRGGGGAETAFWVPVAHMASGGGFGAVSVPRVGSAVIVEFLEGDPDRPIVTGRVYNQLNPHPYSLPAHLSRSAWRTRSTPGGEGFNELRFEDRAGGEEVYLRSQRDLLVEVLNDALRRVGRDERVELVRDRSLSVGGSDTVTVTADRSVSVGGSNRDVVVGAHASSVGGDRSIDVTGKLDLRVGGDASEEVTGDRIRKVSGNEAIAVEGTRTVGVIGNCTTALQGNDWQTVTGTRVVEIGGSLQQTIDGQASAALGALQLAIEGDTWLYSAGEAKVESSTSVKLGAPTVYVSGETLRLRAYDKIILEVGDSESDDRSRIEITTGGVYVTNGSSTKNLTGDTVYLNC